MGGYGFGLMDLTARQSNRKKKTEKMYKLEQMNVCMRMSVKKSVCVSGCVLYTPSRIGKNNRTDKVGYKKKCMTADKNLLLFVGPRT